MPSERGARDEETLVKRVPREILVAPKQHP
jgi:hypothetical protein